MSASRTFPQLHLLTPVFARDAAGGRQSVRLGHYLIPPTGLTWLQLLKEQDHRQDRSLCRRPGLSGVERGPAAGLHGT